MLAAMTSPLRATVRPLLVGLAAVLIVAAGCSDEQKRDIEGAGGAATIADATENTLDDLDIDVDGDLDCSLDVADDDTVSGSCTGTTDDGATVETTVEGTADVDEAECDSTITITLDGETIAREDGYDCFDDEQVDAV